jgi:hypothetical protein
MLVSSEQETEADDEMINRDDNQEINMELDESQREEGGDESLKKEKTDNEWQPEDEKEVDEEYDEDLRKEESQTLFNTTYAESKMKSSCSSLKYMFDYIYHGSRLLQPR